MSFWNYFVLFILEIFVLIKPELLNECTEETFI